VTLPTRDRRPKHRAWTAQEAARFLDVACDDSFEPIWSLAVFTGMRRAELVGLRWQDVDLDAGTILVTQTTTERGCDAITKPPKNVPSRPLLVPTELLTLLREHQKMQALHIEECVDAYTDHDIVCANPYGNAWYPNTITHRFKKLALMASPDTNLHYTRHTYASIALSHGMGVLA
jgi:integrase